MTSKIRKELEALMGIALKGILKKIKEAGFSGRCWDTKESEYKGSHVTLAEGDKIVSTFVKNGKVHILEYELTAGTELGDKVRRILKENNIPVVE